MTAPFLCPLDTISSSSSPRRSFFLLLFLPLFFLLVATLHLPALLQQFPSTKLPRFSQSISIPPISPSPSKNFPLLEVVRRPAIVGGSERHRRGHSCRIRSTVCAHQNGTIFVPAAISTAGNIWTLCGRPLQRIMFYDHETELDSNRTMVDAMLLATGRDDAIIEPHMPHAVEGVMEALAGVVVDEGKGVDVKRWERVGCWEKRRDGIHGKDNVVKCNNGIRVEDDVVGGREGMRKVVLLSKYGKLLKIPWTMELFKALENKTDWNIEFWDANRMFRETNGSMLCFKELSFSAGRHSSLPPAFYRPRVEGRPFGIDMDSVLKDAGVVEEEDTNRSIIGRIKDGARSVFSQPSGDNRDSSKGGWSMMSDKFEKEKVECATNVLILSRNNTRRLLDIPKLKRVLIKETQLEGMSIRMREVKYESMSFVEQAKHMRWADVLITSHGAALANLIFLRPGSTVVEIIPWGYRITFESHSRVLGSTHTIITAEPQSNVVFKCLERHEAEIYPTRIKDKIMRWNASVKEYKERNLKDIADLRNHTFHTFSWANTTTLRTCVRRQNLAFDHKLTAQKLIAQHIPCR